MHLYRFALPLARRIELAGDTLDCRCGVVVELHDETGNVGFGETSPLPGFSRESLDEAQQQLIRLRYSVVSMNVPDHLEELSGGFASWLGEHELYPSARFGFEAAVLALKASRRGVPLERLITDQPRATITVNALLHGDETNILKRAEQLRRQGWSAFKLKVGGRATHDDVRLVRRVRRVIGPDAGLRLDANRQFSADDFWQFAEGVRDCDIEYIEEPLSSLDDLKALSESPKPLLPLALDESLQQINPVDLSRCHGVKAVVLKPTMLGLERAAQFARAAARRGAAAVLSSSYESCVGLTILARLAAAFNVVDVPVGLDTGDCFETNLLPPLPTIGGRIVIDDLADIRNEINRDLLAKITDA